LAGAILKGYFLYPILESAQGRSIRPKLRALKKDSGISFPQRLELIKKRLSALVQSAGDHVPYYRDLFRKLGFKPSNLEKDLAYLNDLPYLTKEMVREQGEKILDERLNRTALQVRKTGGATGPAVPIYYDQEALDWTAASNLFVLEWTGKKRHHREVHFSSRFPEIFPLQDRIKERIKCMALNRVNIVTDSFDADSFAAIWQKLKRARPYLVQGYPSTLYALALFMKKSGKDGTGVIKVFESTGEVLDKNKKDAIESVFGCRIFNRYGSAEFGVVAHETESSGALKVLDFMVYPENYQSEEGKEIVLTGLTNHAMPLIRYRTGDMGKLVTAEDGFYFESIRGRVHDLVPIGGRKYPTHYIQDLLNRIGGIDEFQIEIRDGRSVLRLVVADPAYQDAIERRIKSWWDGMEVEFTDFNGLQRSGARDKFRYVVPQRTNLGTDR